MAKGKKSYYQSLYEVAMAVNSARDPEGVLRSIVENVTDAMGVKGCSLMLLAPDKKVLLHTIGYGLSDWYIKKGPVSADESIAEALEGKIVVILDATTDKRMQYRQQAEKEGIKSVLCAPMMLRGEVVGVMRVYSAEIRSFDDDDKYFAGAVANLGATALDNAKRFDSLQEEYDSFRRLTM
jgi:GAF domain-containing protein